jgi:hypothetical protein
MLRLLRVSEQLCVRPISCARPKPDALVSTRIQQGIAILTINHPPANSISSAVTQALKGAFEKV